VQDAHAHFNYCLARLYSLLQQYNNRSLKDAPADGNLYENTVLWHRNTENARFHLQTVSKAYMDPAKVTESRLQSTIAKIQHATNFDKLYNLIETGKGIRGKQALAMRLAEQVGWKVIRDVDLFNDDFRATLKQCRKDAVAAANDAIQHHIKLRSELWGPATLPASPAADSSSPAAAPSGATPPAAPSAPTATQASAVARANTAAAAPSTTATESKDPKSPFSAGDIMNIVKKLKVMKGRAHTLMQSYPTWRYMNMFRSLVDHSQGKYSDFDIFFLSFIHFVS
jgi:hypothetical protein